MPLYDFVCADCRQATSLLLRHGEVATCPVCGGPLAKQWSAFAIGARARGHVPAPPPAAPAAPASSHVCRAGCSHGPAKSQTVDAPGTCTTDRYAASLIKKYLD